MSYFLYYYRQKLNVIRCNYSTEITRCYDYILLLFFLLFFNEFLNLGDTIFTHTQHFNIDTFGICVSMRISFVEEIFLLLESSICAANSIILNTSFR